MFHEHECFIPVDIIWLTALQILELGGSPTRLPSAAQLLTSLTWLSVHDDDSVELPDQVCSLQPSPAGGRTQIHFPGVHSLKPSPREWGKAFHQRMWCSWNTLILAP